MRGFKVLAAAFGLMIGVLAAVPASAWTRGTVNVLFQLPELEDQPGVRSSVEGIAVRRRDGHVFVATSGFNAGPVAPTGNAYLFEIDPMTGGMVRAAAPHRRLELEHARDGVQTGQQCLVDC